jgi:predicted small secreted protein
VPALAGYGADCCVRLETPIEGAAKVMPNRGDPELRTIVAIALIAASMALAACNTIEGAGKDVSSAGHAVSDTARDAR